MDSLAGETEVPGTQETFANVDQSVADALLCMASTDVSTFKPDKELHDKEIDAAASLLLPVFLPCMYGSQDEVNDAAITLFWIGNGMVHGFGLAMVPDEAPKDEKTEVKRSMFKIFFPSMYEGI